MPKSAYQVLGDRTYSYGTCIRQTLRGAAGFVISNVTYYSPTTTLHQRKANCWRAEILLQNVPRGTTDLIPFAIKHGVLEPARIMDIIAKYAP